MRGGWSCPPRSGRDVDASIVIVLSQVPVPADAPYEWCLCCDDGATSEDDEELGAKRADGCCEAEEVDDAVSENGEASELTVSMDDIEHPREEVKKIFQRVFLKEYNFGWADGELEGATYQRDVRRALSHLIVRKSGLLLRSSRSVDGKCVFWQVSATRERLEALAEKFHYVMQYSDRAYEDIDVEPHTVEGVSIRPHGRYTQARADDFEEFKSSDAIRLVMRELMLNVDLHELERQGVIECWFPAKSGGEVKDVKEELLRWSRGRRGVYPQSGEADRVQEYFGEEVAVVFSFYAAYVKALRWPALLAVLVLYAYYRRPFHLNLLQVHTLFGIFGCCMIIWGSWFCAHAEHVIMHSRLRWGWKAKRLPEMHISSYEPARKNQGTRKLHPIIGQLATALFMIFVVIVCIGLAFHSVPVHIQNLVTIFLSWVWGRVAWKIVALEKKRTQPRFNRALVMRVAFVQLFTYFFPIIRLAFVDEVNDSVCGTLERASPVYYNNNMTTNNLLDLGITSHEHPLFQRWMNETAKIQPANFVDLALLRASDLDFGLLFRELGHEFGNAKMGDFSQNRTTHCYRGCFPHYCEINQLWSGGRDLHCECTCIWELRYQLWSLLFTHLLMSLLNATWPFMRTTCATWWSARPEGVGHGGHAQDESRLDLHCQWECHKVARYEYGAGGGSQVEDFVRIAKVFSFLVLFSVVSPAMTVVCALLQVLEYRILALRMTYATSRPYPRSSCGLRESLQILEIMTSVAICVYPFLLVTVMKTYLDEVGFVDKVLATGALSAFLAGVKVFIRLLYAEQSAAYLAAVDHFEDFASAKMTATIGAMPLKPNEIHTQLLCDIDYGVCGTAASAPSTSSLSTDEGDGDMSSFSTSSRPAWPRLHSSPVWAHQWLEVSSGRRPA